jgi:hypothetical protein
MALLAPPPVPPQVAPVAQGDNDGLRRMRLRLWQISMSAVTIFITAWFCTLGPIPAIAALMIAKHILVVVIIAGHDAERDLYRNKE